jgi:hypothetical protein
MGVEMKMKMSLGTVLGKIKSLPAMAKIFGE